MHRGLKLSYMDYLFRYPWSQQELNLRPLDFQSSALTVTELQNRTVYVSIVAELYVVYKFSERFSGRFFISPSLTSPMMILPSLFLIAC